MKPSPRVVLPVAGVVATGLAFSAWALRGSGGANASAVALGLTILIAVPQLIAVYAVSRFRAKSSFLLVAVFALALRVPFLVGDPVHSDDVYRYLWDGRVQTAGHSPYGTSPDDPSLDDVEASWPPESRVRDLVNHPEIPTIYPPVMQGLFGLVAFLGGGLVLWRLLLIAVELAVARVLASALDAQGRSRAGVIAFLWHPLALIENVGSAHTEIVAVAGFAVAVHLAAQSKWGASGVAVAFGGLAKILPFAFFAHAIRSGLRSREFVRFALAATASSLVLVLPYVLTLDDVGRAIEGFRRYSGEWYANDLIFRPVGFLIGLDPEDRTLESTQIWRRVLQGAWVGSVLVFGWRVRDPWRFAYCVSASFVVLTPTLHPWYLLWVLVPAIVCRGWSFGVLTITVLFSYTTQIAYVQTGTWVEPGFVRVIEWLPVAVLMTRRWWPTRPLPDPQENSA